MQHKSFMLMSKNFLSFLWYLVYVEHTKIFSMDLQHPEMKPSFYS